MPSNNQEQRPRSAFENFFYHYSDEFESRFSLKSKVRVVSVLLLAAGATVAYPASVGPDKPTAKTKVEVTTTSLPTLRYTDKIGSYTISCVVGDLPVVVATGDNMSEIVRDHQTPANPAILQLQIDATIDLNQQHHTIGSNPNLIYKGQTIYLMQDCAVTG